MKNRLVIIRGNAGSGKSTVAEELRNHFKGKVAVIHTEIFYYGIVRGDDPEIAMENTRRIIDNYLKNKYTVILEGTLSNKNKNNISYVDNFVNLARKYKVPVSQFFLKADFSELIKREGKRQKISVKKLRELYEMTNKTRAENEIIIDTTKLKIRQVVDKIAGEIK